MIKSLQTRIANIRSKDKDDFILVDAKDPDLSFGISATGYKDKTDPSLGYRSLNEFQKEICEVVEQGIIDVMLTSIFSYDCLVAEKDIFKNSSVTPAVRINSSTDLWMVRGGKYSKQPSRPYRHASLETIIYGIGKQARESGARVTLGLYSITFTNDTEMDLLTMSALRDLYEEAAELNFDYILEVFPPNIDCGLSPQDIPAFCNDQIARIISLTPKDAQPLFLKIPYLGPEALQELTGYHPDTIVGILGGSSGTTYDSFMLVSEAQKYGARAAIFGRRIKNAEDPLFMVKMLREIVNEGLDPLHAVELYHQNLENKGIKPIRSLADDCKLVHPCLDYLK